MTGEVDRVIGVIAGMADDLEMNFRNIYERLDKLESNVIGAIQEQKGTDIIAVMVQEITDLKAEIKAKDDLIFELKSKEGQLIVKDELINTLKFSMEDLKLNRMNSVPQEDCSSHQKVHLQNKIEDLLTKNGMLMQQVEELKHKLGQATETVSKKFGASDKIVQQIRDSFL